MELPTFEEFRLSIGFLILIVIGIFGLSYIYQIIRDFFKEGEEKDIRRTEWIVSALLIIVGALSLFASYKHWIKNELGAELVRDIGIACVVAFIIKFINEIFLSRKLEYSFERQNQKIARSVLDYTFQQTVPSEVFREIKNIFSNDLQCIRDDYQLIFEFSKLEDGRTKLVTNTVYTVTNLLEKDINHAIQLGIVEDDVNCKKKVKFISYKNGKKFEGNAEPLIDLIQIITPTEVDKYGEIHKEFRHEISIQKGGSISIKHTTETIYDKNVKEEHIKLVFMYATNNVSIRVKKLVAKMDFKTSQFASKEFEESKDLVSDDERLWKYNGCFLPHQGIIFSWFLLDEKETI